MIGSISFFLYSCSGKESCEEIPDTSKIKVDVKIERLDKELAKVSNKKDLHTLINSHPTLKKVFSADQYPNDSVFIDEFYKILSDSTTDSLFNDVEKIYSNLSDLENQFKEAFKIIKYYYPNFKIPQVKTISSGFFSPDFYFTDSTIYIGLDYFLGPQGHYLPPGQPEYIVKHYQKEYIIPTCVRIISEELNATDILDKTMLAEMIYWGKTYYFMNKILPCTPDSLIIAYSQKQLRVAIANQEKIWSHFVDKQLLFETSHFIKTKYIGERPYTAEISNKCPGRIGQWLGWKIVNKYMSDKDGEVSLQQLMATRSAQQIFNESKFKPKDGKDF